MNLKEALIALVDGKKIRKKCWSEDKFLFIGYSDVSKSLAVLDEKNFIADHDLYSDDWELYIIYDTSFHKAFFEMYEYGTVFESTDKDLYRVNNRKLERSIYFSSERRNANFGLCGADLYDLQKLKFRRCEDE